MGNYLEHYFQEETKLLSMHQFGFWSNDSCVNQLLLIVHNLYKAFGDVYQIFYPTLEKCEVILDISKTFGKSGTRLLVSLAQGLIFKPKSFGASNSLLSLVENFLSNRFQRVLLNDHTCQ